MNSSQVDRDQLEAFSWRTAAQVRRSHSDEVLPQQPSYEWFGELVSTRAAYTCYEKRRWSLRLFTADSHSNSMRSPQPQLNPSIEVVTPYEKIYRTTPDKRTRPSRRS
jgi:hypothetical protein